MKVALEYADRDVVLFTVTYDDDMDELDRFMKENDYDFPVLVDDRSKGVTGPLYQVGPIPTLFLIDPSGKITYKHVGYEEGDEEELRQEIDKIVTPT